jgi:hypothetical protein
MICVAAAALGFDVGWERLPEGGMKYIIQLTPETLETLRSMPIESDIPPTAGEIRSYRIMVGTGKLPHDEPPLAVPQAQPNIGPQLPESTSAEAKPSPPVRPQTLTPEPGARLLPGQSAGFVEPAGTAPAKPPTATDATDTEAKGPAKPWLPLTLTLLGLFTSLGTNVYLGWLAWDSRQRWRNAQDEKRPAGG